MNEILTQAADVWAAIDWADPWTATFVATLVAAAAHMWITDLWCIAFKVFRGKPEPKPESLYGKHRREREPDTVREGMKAPARMKAPPAYAGFDLATGPDEMGGALMRVDDGGFENVSEFAMAVHTASETGEVDPRLEALADRNPTPQLTFEQMATFREGMNKLNKACEQFSRAVSNAFKPAIVAMENFAKAVTKLLPGTGGGVPSLDDYNFPPPPALQYSADEVANAVSMMARAGLPLPPEGGSGEMAPAGVPKHGLTMTKDDIDRLRQSWHEASSRPQTLKPIELTMAPPDEPVVFELDQHYPPDAVDMMGKQLKEAYGDRRIVLLPPGMHKVDGAAVMKLPEGESLQPNSITAQAIKATIKVKFEEANDIITGAGDRALLSHEEERYDDLFNEIKRGIDQLARLEGTDTQEEKYGVCRIQANQTYCEGRGNFIEVVSFGATESDHPAPPEIHKRPVHGFDIQNLNPFPLVVRYQYRQNS